MTSIVLETSIGWVAAAARGGRVIRLSLPAPTRHAALAGCGAGGADGRPDGILDSLAADLRLYFEGRRVDFSHYEIDLGGTTSFLRRALHAARRIPYGEVRSYGWLAAQAGSPRAVRAAGQAMSINPVPLIIPCHRVVGAGGALVGFGGGLALKRALLEREGVRFVRDRVAEE